MPNVSDWNLEVHTTFVLEENTSSSKLHFTGLRVPLSYARLMNNISNQMQLHCAILHNIIFHNILSGIHNHIAMT